MRRCASNTWTGLAECPQERGCDEAGPRNCEVACLQRGGLALKIVAIGIFVSTGLNVKATLVMIMVGLTILIYAVMGGLWAVVITDFVQFILVTGTVLLLFPLAWRASGGWHRISEMVPASFFHIVRAPYGSGYIASFGVLSLLSLSGNWSLIQKFYSCRSDKEARSVGWLATVLFLLLPPL